MGCFSYMCPECDDNIKEHEMARAYYLKDGVSVEEQRGFYDLYGRLIPVSEVDAATGPNFFDTGKEWESETWDDMVDTHFNGDKKSGFLFVHERCVPGCYEPQDTISEDDPDQGGVFDYDDYEEEDDEY